MSPLPIGMIIEGLVAMLLLVTIGYCFTLNRRLQRLRADEETLRATISELMTATEIAERAILGLKTTATEADRTLGERLQAAEKMSSALASKVGEGEKIFNRISQIAEAARSAAVQRETVHHHHAAPSPHHAPAPGYGNTGHIRQQPGADAAPGYSSQGYGSAMVEPDPAHVSSGSAAAPRRARADDIRTAAAEATARLERFRKRSGGAAA